MAAKIYLDYSASTPVSPEVWNSMEPYFKTHFGNPSSVHRWGQTTRAAIEEARSQIAAALNVQESEIVFTSGGTEANNLALKGAAAAETTGKRHMIVSAIEHKSVLNCAKALEKQGFQITYLNPDQQGRINPDQVRQAIQKDTMLISIMHGNNEIGTLNPIAEIGEIAAEKGILFHTDAVQTFGKTELRPQDLPVNLLSISSHKIYGPKGAGALFIRKGTAIQPVLHGSSHEQNRRAGTENVPGIVGFGKAAEMAVQHVPLYQNKVRELRDFLESGIREIYADVLLNGHPEQRLPHITNLSFPGIEGDNLLLNLDLAGVAASAGSACSSGSIQISHVLKALQLEPKRTLSAVRFSLGLTTTKNEIIDFLERLEKILHRLGAMGGIKVQ
ncbi:MAG: cysteine desulfurase family protein [Calditrichia bacterium]